MARSIFRRAGPSRQSQAERRYQLELQPSSRVNHCCASGMSIARLTRRLWRAARLDVVSLYWDLASIYLDRSEFHNQWPGFARIGTRGRDLSKDFGSCFQYNVSPNRNVLRELCLKASACDSLRADETYRTYYQRCSSGDRGRM
jgi:hypothetical protein